MSLKTALHSWHAGHGARLIDFGGWDMPVQYSSIVEEHLAVRNGFGLFDVSHMGRIEVKGPQATAFLQYLCTNQIENLKPGQVRYNLICREDGNILDDILVYRVEGNYLLVVNASNREKILAWMGKHQSPFAVQFHDKTLETSMIALQGPKALAAAKNRVTPDPTLLDYYFCAPSKVQGEEALVSRTGYTGEDGVEIIVAKGTEVSLWEKLTSLGGVPCGLGARDTLRLEAAMPLYGHEINEETNPLEAGLGWAVKLEKENFIGKQSLLAFKSQPQTRKRVGVILESKRIPREGCELIANERVVGKVTSGTFSPTLGKPIAMGYLTMDLAHPGIALEVDIRGKRETAHVVTLPFYKRSRP